MDFDNILPQIGQFHRYQFILFLLLCFPFCFYITFVYFAQIFITLEPDHWCLIPQLIDSGLPSNVRREWSIPTEKRDGSLHFSQCRMYDIDYDYLLFNITSANNTDLRVKDSWNTIPCQYGWEYDYSEIYPTAVSEWDWVCDDNWKAPLAQSLFFVGCVVGCIIFGLVSDWLGRIPALVMTNALACAAGIATAFSQGFVTFAIFRFFMGMTFDTCFMVYYILVLEYVDPTKRTLISNTALGLFYTLSTVLFPWIARGIGDWRTFSIVVSAPMGTVLLMWRFLPESARWLLSKGRIEEASKIIIQIAKFNKKELKPTLLSELQIAVEQECKEREKVKYTILDLLKMPKLRRRTLLLFSLWFLISLSYDGHARNTHNLGYNVFISFTIASATELPAAVLIILLLDYIGRRWLSLLSLLLGGIISLCYIVVPQDVPWLGMTLAMLGRLFINVAFNIGLQYVTELMPTVVRGQGMAAAHVLGFVATIISPFVVYLSHYNQSLPLIVFGILSIFAGALSLFLPETLNRNLPQTLEDGENFGKDQSFWHFPCLKQSKSRSTNNGIPPKISVANCDTPL